MAAKERDEMNEAAEPRNPTWRDLQARRWGAFLKQREEQVFLALTLLIGSLVGLTVVAFIVLTEHCRASTAPHRRACPPPSQSAV